MNVWKMRARNLDVIFDAWLMLYRANAVQIYVKLFNILRMLHFP